MRNFKSVEFIKTDIHSFKFNRGSTKENFQDFEFDFIFEPANNEQQVSDR